MTLRTSFHSEELIVEELKCVRVLRSVGPRRCWPCCSKVAPQLAHKTEMRTKSRNTAEDKLAELQQKYALLEDDRKAHYEASQWTIKQNKETLLLAKSANDKVAIGAVNALGIASKTNFHQWASWPMTPMIGATPSAKTRPNSVGSVTR